MVATSSSAARRASAARGGCGCCSRGGRSRSCTLTSMLTSPSILCRQAPLSRARLAFPCWSFGCKAIVILSYSAGTMRVRRYQPGVGMQILMSPRSQPAQVIACYQPRNVE